MKLRSSLMEPPKVRLPVLSTIRHLPSPKEMPNGIVRVDGKVKDFGENQIVAEGASQSSSPGYQRSAIYHHQKQCLMDC